MDKILVSACLLGQHCRYDGSDCANPLLEELNRFFDLVPFCPECEGGLPTPRLPSEIKDGRVYTKNGENVTKYYNLGAEKALRLCKLLNIHIAILKDKSPACGVYEIHDGTFSGKTKKGMGVTASLLSSFDYWLMSEGDIPGFLEKQKAKRQLVDQKTEEYRLQEKMEQERQAQSSEELKEPRYEDKPRRSYKPRYEDRPYRKEAEEGEEGRKPFRKSYGDRKPYGEKRSYGNKKPYGDHKPYGDRKSFAEGKEYGEKRSYGDHKPYGDKKPYGDRKPYFKDGAASGDKPYFKKYHHDEEGSSYERKPRAYGDRKPYGEKRSYGDRKPYGDKKSYGERKPYFKKEGSGYRKPFKKSFGGSKGPRKAYSSFKKNGDSSDE